MLGCLEVDRDGGMSDVLERDMLAIVNADCRTGMYRIEASIRFVEKVIAAWFEVEFE